MQLRSTQRVGGCPRDQVAGGPQHDRSGLARSIERLGALGWARARSVGRARAPRGPPRECRRPGARRHRGSQPLPIGGSDGHQSQHRPSYRRGRRHHGDLLRLDACERRRGGRAPVPGGRHVLPGVHQRTHVGHRVHRLYRGGRDTAGRGRGYGGGCLPRLYVALQLGSPDRERDAQRGGDQLRHLHQPRRRRRGDERRLLRRRPRHDGGRGRRLDDGRRQLHPHLHPHVAERSGDEPAPSRQVGHQPLPAGSAARSPGHLRQLRPRRGTPGVRDGEHHQQRRDRLLESRRQRSVLLRGVRQHRPRHTGGPGRPHRDQPLPGRQRNHQDLEQPDLRLQRQHQLHRRHPARRCELHPLRLQQHGRRLRQRHLRRQRNGRREEQPLLPERRQLQPAGRVQRRQHQQPLGPRAGGRPRCESA